MSDASPIQRFLGDVKMEHGPFGLLNIPPRQHDAQTINRALGAQLARLARHPQGMSTEADEVRLALHVAAAQLRDFEVQREVLVECSYPHRARASEKPDARSVLEREASATSQPSAQVATSLQVHTSRLAMFERAALWVLIHSGGWNREAQRRLGSLAHTFGVDQSDFRRSLAELSKRNRGPRVSRPAAPGRRAYGAAAQPMTTGPDDDDERLEEAFPVSSLVRLAILLVLTVTTGVMVWRLVTIRVHHAPLRGATAPAGIASGESEDQFAERTITMPGLPAPTNPERASDTGSESDGVRSGSRLPLPSAPDAQLPPDVNVDRVIADWERRARSAIDRAGRSRSPHEHLEHAVRMAMVNLAAAKHWTGAASDARTTMRTLESYRPPRLSVTATEQRRLVDLVASMTGAGELRDGDVAMLFMLARRQPQRYLPELRQIRIGADPLGPVDADVVAEAVLFASPNELRQLASGFALRQADNPVMIYALLEALAEAPRHEAGSTLIQQVTGRTLPHPREDIWALEARRALLGRLFELLGRGADPGVDDLAGQLALQVSRTAVALGAVDPASSATAGPSGTPLDPALAMRTLARRWRELGETYLGATWFAERTAELEQRRVLRLALARGPIQRFSAEQTSAVEHMGELVRAERPSQTRAIDVILDEFARRRRDSTHVFEQISAGQLASASLWRLRFGLEAS